MSAILLYAFAGGLFPAVASVAWAQTAADPASAEDNQYSPAELWLWTLGTLGHDDITLDQERAVVPTGFVHRVREANGRHRWSLLVSPNAKTVTVFDVINASAPQSIKIAQWKEVFGDPTEELDPERMNESQQTKLETMEQLLAGLAELDERSDELELEPYRKRRALQREKIAEWLTNNLGGAYAKALAHDFVYGSHKLRSRKRHQIAARLTRRFGAKNADTILSTLNRSPTFNTIRTDQLVKMVNRAEAAVTLRKNGTELKGKSSNARKHRQYRSFAGLLGNFNDPLLAKTFLDSGIGKERIFERLAKTAEDPNEIKILLDRWDDALHDDSVRPRRHLYSPEGFLQQAKEAKALDSSSERKHVDELDHNRYQQEYGIKLSAAQWLHGQLGIDRDLARDFTLRGKRRNEVLGGLTKRLGAKEAESIVNTLSEMRKLLSRGTPLENYVKRAEKLAEDKATGLVTTETYESKRKMLIQMLALWLGRRFSLPGNVPLRIADFQDEQTRKSAIDQMTEQLGEDETRATVDALDLFADVVEYRQHGRSRDRSVTDLLKTARAISASNSERRQTDFNQVREMTLRWLATQLGGWDGRQIASQFVSKGLSKETVAKRLEHRLGHEQSREILVALEELRRLIPHHANISDHLSATEELAGGFLAGTLTHNEYLSELMNLKNTTRLWLSKLLGRADGRELTRRLFTDRSNRDAIFRVLVERFGQGDANHLMTSLDILLDRLNVAKSPFSALVASMSLLAYREPTGKAASELRHLRLATGKKLNQLSDGAIDLAVTDQFLTGNTGADHIRANLVRQNGQVDGDTMMAGLEDVRKEFLAALKNVYGYTSPVASPKPSPPDQSFFHKAQKAAMHAEGFINATGEDAMTEPELRRLRQSLRYDVLNSLATYLHDIGHIARTTSLPLARSFLLHGESGSELAELMTGTLGQDESNRVMSTLEVLQKRLGAPDVSRRQTHGIPSFPFAFSHHHMLRDFVPEGFVKITLDAEDQTKLIDAIGEESSVRPSRDILSVFTSAALRTSNETAASSTDLGATPSGNGELFIVFKDELDDHRRGMAYFSRGGVKAVRVFEPHKQGLTRRRGMAK